MTIALSILPIFLVIIAGLVGKRLGFFPDEFLQTGNRLAYYLAIPALIFRAIANAPVAEAFQPLAASVGLGALVLTWLAALWVSGVFYKKEQSSSRASWVQCSTHGNQGILGLAVIFYGMGTAGVGAAGLIVTVIIVGQNLLSMIILTRWGAGGKQRGSMIRAVVLSPIIAATLAGLAWSASGLDLPGWIDRTLQILANMGLPLALLIIGANLGGPLAASGGLLSLGTLFLFKLLLAPALGLGLLLALGVDGLPAVLVVVLLSSPSATVCAIMAGQMGGDVKLTSTAITLTHALSTFTYGLWLWVGGLLFQLG